MTIQMARQQKRILVPFCVAAEPAIASSSERLSDGLLDHGVDETGATGGLAMAAIESKD